MGRLLLLLPILMLACATPAAPNIGSTRAALTAPAPGPLYAAADFGAVPDDGQDDLAELQAAVHAAILQRRPLTIEPGLYLISDTLFIGGDHALCGTPTSPLSSCSFISLTMAGLNSGSASGKGANIRTMFGPGRLDRPAINIQGARDVRLANLSIQGENDIPRSGSALTSAYIETDPALWACETCSLERHSPYAGIVIDGYSGDEPADGYPVGPRISYTGNGTPHHSSYLEFDTVGADSFSVGMAINPSPHGSNAEDIALRRVRLTYNAFGLVMGGSQSRNVTVTNGNLAWAHTLVTTTRFGLGMAPPPVIRDSNLGAAFQLFDYRHTQGVAVIDAVYAEAYGWIGSFGLENNSAPAPVVVTGGGFNAYGFANYIPPFQFVTMAPVSFRGAAFHSDRGQAFSYMTSGEASSVSFDTCTWALHGHGIAAGYRPVGGQMLAGEERKTSSRNSSVVWGSTHQAVNTEHDYWVTSPRYLSPSVRRLYDAHTGALTEMPTAPTPSSHSVTNLDYDHAAKLVTFTPADASAFAVGDWLLSWATSPANRALGGWVPALQVTAVAGGVVTADMRVSDIGPGNHTDRVWRVVPPVP